MNPNEIPEPSGLFYHMFTYEDEPETFRRQFGTRYIGDSVSDKTMQLGEQHPNLFRLAMGLM